MQQSHLKQYLGWLHREEGVMLEDLSLNRIIHVSPLKLNLDDFRQTPERYQYAKSLAQEEAEEIATEDLKRIQKYLEDFLNNNASSRQKRVAGLIALAKSQYAEIIGTTDFPDVKNIPVI